MAYSIDFRKAAISFMEKGHTEKELLETFGIYASNVNRWRKLQEKQIHLFRNTGKLANEKST